MMPVFTRRQDERALREIYQHEPLVTIFEKMFTIRYSLSRATGDGRSITLAELRGRPVLLSSWATWCSECKEEFPGLQRTWRDRQAAGLQVIAVNVDGPLPGRAIRAVLDKYGLTMPVWLDSNNAYAITFHALGVPTSVLLDADGHVVKQWNGQIDFGNAEVKTILDQVLGGQQ